MDYELSISPGISTHSRGNFEDAFDSFLEDYGGETTGGGTMIDGSESNVDFTAEGTIPTDKLESYLRSSKLSGTLEVRDLGSDKTVLSMTVDRKPWWKLW